MTTHLARASDGRIMDRIIDAASSTGGVSAEQILSGGLTRRVVACRHLVFYVARRDFGLTFHAIADAMDMHHTTVIHGERVFARRLQEQTEYRVALGLIREQLEHFPVEASLEQTREEEQLRRQARAEAQGFLHRKADVRDLYRTVLPPFRLEAAS